MAKKVVPGSITDAYTNRKGDFSPDLVGFQFTKSSSLFTLGNFSLTTNASPLTEEIFNTGEFSEPTSLSTLNLTLTESEVLESSNNNLSVQLRNNKSNFLSYVYFGNATKFLETELTDIITRWNGSLYLKKSTINDTVVDYSYNIDKNITTFSIPINVASNVFNLDTFSDSINNTDESDISVLRYDYSKYVISNDNGVFNVVDYIGNNATSDYIVIDVSGNAWENLTGSTSGSFTYHLKPNDESLEKYFFSKLSDFQTQLMNRLTTPKYTLHLDVPYQNSLGYTIKTTTSYTWPTSDGFNIDIDTREYKNYLESVFSLITSLDSDTTNIMVRRLVSSSILEFDTIGDGTENTGRKMDKLLKIWGREYDEVKKYIDGISFANVVSYDGVDNTPDELIKMLASNLGFDTIQSFSDNNLINYLATTTNTVFSGDSRSLSIKEMDTELWRRLVINAWWLFKSKGTRKVIEFFLNLFQINECLVDLDECVYLVESTIDVTDTLIKLNDYYGIGGYDTDEFPMDSDGYPKILPNTPDYYFQMNGFWYDGGVPANTVPDTNGNNPHFGPYDFGRQYFDKFRCFIDGFVPITETLNLNLLTFNYFTDYSLGTVEGTGESLVDIDNNTSTTTPTGNILTGYDQFYGGVMNTNDRITSGSTVLNAGSTEEQSNSGGSSFKINFNTGDGEDCKHCPDQVTLANDGVVTYAFEGSVTNITDEDCCSIFGYEMFVDNTNNSTNTSCYWCPPISVFQEVILSSHVTIVQFTNSEGILETPSRDCCTIRGYVWDKANRRCTPGQTTSPIPIRPVENQLQYSNSNDCPTEIAITIDGFVLGDGQPLTRTCCDNITYASWVKGGCKIN